MNGTPQPPSSPGPQNPSSDSHQGWVSNWFTRLYRSDVGSPLLPVEFVAGQGANVRLIDIREPHEFIGPMGYIPGSDWVPTERLDTLLERLGPDAPLIIITSFGERASHVARSLEAQGMRFVAALAGGMSQWRSFGYSTTRDPSILERCDVLRSIEPPVVEPGGKGLTIEQVEAHLGDPLAVRWIKRAALTLHAQLSCIDGRDDRGIIGTPGGDAGLFLLALAAIERVIGRPLDGDVIAGLLERRIDALGGFYMHTDHIAMSAAADSMRHDSRLSTAVAEYGSDPTEWRQFLRRPPLSLREAVLDHLCHPTAIGCGHIRLMYQNSGDYQVRPALVRDFLRAFFHARWEGAFRAEYESLSGVHEERAVVNTRIELRLRPFTPIPLISPSYFHSQMFVYHPQVSDYLRWLLIDFLLLQTDLVPEFKEDLTSVLHAESDRLNAIQTKQSLGHLAKGLPVFDVTFAADNQVRVEHAGVVD